jgi:hypothetical protein
MQARRQGHLRSGDGMLGLNAESQASFDLKLDSDLPRIKYMSLR